MSLKLKMPNFIGSFRNILKNKFNAEWWQIYRDAGNGGADGIWEIQNIFVNKTEPKLNASCWIN